MLRRRTTIAEGETLAGQPIENQHQTLGGGDRASDAREDLAETLGGCPRQRVGACRGPAGRAGGRRRPSWGRPAICACSASTRPGRSGLVDLVDLMAQHVSDAALLIAFAQHLPAGRIPLPTMP